MSAFVVHAPGVKVWAAGMIPSGFKSWVLYRKVQIATWELYALSCGLRWITEQSFEHFELALCVGNKVALSAVLRGSSRQPDHNELLSGIWATIAQRGMLTHGWWVPSHLNLADAPTRPPKKAREIEHMRSQGFCQIPWPCLQQAPWRA